MRGIGVVISLIPDPFFSAPLLSFPFAASVSVDCFSRAPFAQVNLAKESSGAEPPQRRIYPSSKDNLESLNSIELIQYLTNLKRRPAGGARNR